jgi:hypothetical protein
METFNSNYLGIVLQNNDPEGRGRVKVWVPHINSSIYNKWNVLKQDRKFRFPGKNIASDLSLIIEDLKDDLPWAEFAGPIMGESSSGQYNARADNASVSDAVYNFSLSASDYSNTATTYQLNNEKFGEKPGAVYEKYNTKLTDAFTNSTTKANPHGANYRPSTYSNAPKGIFSVPAVGAHVWVFFQGGVPFYPVYFAAAFSQQDLESIFKAEDGTAQDYPGAFENKEKRVKVDADINNTTYRNKMVLNQRGAAIEIINTSDREGFKVTHFAGGFLELNNHYNSIFSPKNLQLLTVQDKFETVRGNSSSYVGRDYEDAVKGNYVLNVGALNKSAMDDWVTAYTAVANLLALPEGNASKDTLVQVLSAATQALAVAETKLGFGGNYVETITKHKFLNVGLIFNPFASYRINQNPKVVSQYVNVNSTGTVLTTANISLVEYTHVDDMPGGNLTQTIGNRYNLLVGAGGLDIKTTGPVNLGGTIMAIVGTQMNLASNQDFNIDGGTNLSVIADLVDIRSRNKQQVTIDDNLGINKNLVIGGGAYINGETYLQHVTAPVEFQVTESTKITDPGYGLTGQGTITIQPGGSGNALKGTTYTVDITLNAGTLTINQPHTHYFKNLPLTLVANPAAVRTTAITTVNAGTAAAPAAAPNDHYNTAGGNKNADPNGPVDGVPG